VDNVFDNAGIERLYAAIREKERLSKLTNEALVHECLALDVSDSPIVEEMLDRIDPGWYEREQVD
jgi:hypothetical protein